MKAWKKTKKQAGYSLIELILVLTISSLAFMGVIKYNQKQAEISRAENAGLQFQEVGSALGQYITRNYSILSTNVLGGSSMVVPISILQGTAFTSGGVTYPGNLLLPTTFANQNLFRTNYVLTIRNTGNSVHGLVTTSAAVVEGGSIRYDWIGTAMKKAGPQSGMTFMNATTMSGLDGSWTLNNTAYPDINTAGKFGYRVTYQGNYDDVYLRLDGAFPMVGNLDMGNYNINNATDINSSGWINGNNALLNNLRTGFIYNSGNFQNDGNIRTFTTVGFGTGNFSQFERLIATASVDTQFINRPGTGGGAVADVTLGNPYTGAAYNPASTDQQGMLYARDIFITGARPGAQARPVQGWLSDRLPQYVSRGILARRDGELVDKPPCGTGIPRIELIPQSQYVQGRVMGTMQLTGTNGNMTLYQDQYSIGQFSVYADDLGTQWRVNVKTPVYNAGYTGQTNALAHMYCDYGV